MNRSRSHRRHGFTFIELIVVIAIIVILASLLIPAISILHKASLKAKTLNNMEQLAHSVLTYLDTYARLGNLNDPTETDKQHSLAFRCDPWYFLYITPFLSKAEPFFAPSGLKLVTATGATCVPATSPLHATHLCDAWGTNPDNVLSWAIVNGSPLGSTDMYTFTQSIDLRSSAGTPSDMTDDIILHYASQTQRWDVVKVITVPWNSPLNFNEPLPAAAGEHP